MKSNLESVEGIHYKYGNHIRINMKGGFVHSIENIEMKRNDLLTIAPGFVDLQVNGYMGIDFNNVGEKNVHMHAILRQLLAVGVTTLYPTIITNSVKNIKILVTQIFEWLQADKLANEMIAGIHLEGPFLSKEDGPRGAHSASYIQQPDWELFKEINQSVNGLIKIITLSPEWDSSPSFIEKAVNESIVVAIGHTAANSEQIKKAVEAGATLSTHLGNGAHSVLPRHPNYIWDQLSTESLAATVIADGFHLPESVLYVFEKIKGNQMILVSDSVSLAGLPPGNYETTVGGKVTLTKSGRLQLKDNPLLLAGSAQTILHGVNHLISIHLNTCDEAIDKASVLPAKLLQLPLKKGIEVGAPADLILFEQSDQQISIVKTIKAGKLLFQKRS